jgi:heme-degrading monooxygenase HmoA
MSSDTPVLCIFRSQRTDHSDEEYAEWSKKMDHLVRTAPGYVDHASFREEASGQGVTISYFRSMPDLVAWKQQTEHLEAQALGREAFYHHYEIEVAEIVRQYEWTRSE